MKIIVSQENKKISIKFCHGKVVDGFVVSKSDEFLNCVDKLLPPYGWPPVGWEKARLEFKNTGLLTERIIRVIILGLSF
ncbi:MAG: hypothetical protein ABIG73_00290 [Patescibacteria group bacterium]